jgi:hypothetical protein
MAAQANIIAIVIKIGCSFAKAEEAKPSEAIPVDVLVDVL